jgi:hypothetical protein
MRLPSKKWWSEFAFGAFWGAVGIGVYELSVWLIGEIW